MANSQFSLLRHVIENQAEKPGDASVPPATPDLSGSFPVAGAPVTPRNGPAPSSVPAAPRSVPVGPAARTAAHSGHMKLLFDNAPVAMAMFDTDMRYLLANRRWLEDFKLTKVDVTGRSQYDLFPSLHPGWRHVYNRALGGQVVRSDRDAITQDGKRVVYRWEVRPWRHMDTTIGGVTISCERLYQGQGGSPPPAAEEKPEPQEESLWKTKMPLLALTAKGRILRVSEGLARSVPDCTKEEEPVFFWDAFAAPEMHAPVRRASLVALEAVLSGGETQASIFTYPVQENKQTPAPSAPIQWLVSKLGGGLSGVEGDVALVVGLHGVAPAAKAEPVAEHPMSGPSSQEWDQFTAEIGRLRQAQKEALDAAALSRQRETRLRAVLELAPCGLMVIDEQACAIYQNAHVPALVGHAVPEGLPMHQWLANGARDEQHRAEVVRLWTEEVWRKRNAVPVPLTGADGLHHEIEMRPVPLPGGGLLLMLQDVTEFRRSEEMLRSTEAKFRTLVHENPLPVVLADRSGGVFDVNPACEVLLGHTRAEMRRIPLEQWLDAESLSRRAAALQEMILRGERYSEFPVQVVNAAEHSIPMQLRMATVPDASGQPMFTLHFFSPVLQQAAAGGAVEPALSPEPVSEMPLLGGVEDEHELAEAQAAVMKTSAALAEAAARIKTFAPAAKAPAEPEAIAPEAMAPVAAEVEAETPAPPPLFVEAVSDSTSASIAASEPVSSELPAEPEVVLPAADPWSAAHLPAQVSPVAFDPWRVPQGPSIEDVAGSDPWRAPHPQVEAFVSPVADPWSAPQSPVESFSGVQAETTPSEIASSEIASSEIASSETTPPELTPVQAGAPEVPQEPLVAGPLTPPATTPLQEEEPPVEEIPASAGDANVIEAIEEVSAVALLSTDVHGQITVWTTEACERFGFSEGEMLGRGLHHLFRPSDSTGLQMEILSLPGWETAASSAVTWQFFHKLGGRQESVFTLIPLEQGGLSLILQETRRRISTQEEPQVLPVEPSPPLAVSEEEVALPPASFLEPAATEAPVAAEASTAAETPEVAETPVVPQALEGTEAVAPEAVQATAAPVESAEPVVTEPESELSNEVSSSSANEPFAGTEPAHAAAPAFASVPVPEVEADDEAMTPPPPLLDDEEMPEQWMTVPANLLEDNLPPIQEPAPAPFNFYTQTFEQQPAVAPSPEPADVAPLTLTPPQRMFADTPPLAPKPLSLAPPQSLYKDAQAAAAVDAGLASASSARPAPVPMPVPEPAPAPSLASEVPVVPPTPLQQPRPTFEELQRERLLLGETHHRVKNHLQIITSMLNLQMSTLHNEEARDALRSSQNRVRSIAALHQHLYLLTTGESADFRAFATGLISHLRECYHVPKERVSLMLHIPDRLLPEEWLMPLALALNEMVSNAFKHAWPDERPGSMSVTLTCGETETGTQHGRLTVSDDGIGLPEDFEQRDHPGMGMKILRVFAGQLGGEVRTRTGNAQGRGVSFDLVFPSLR